MTIKKLPVMFFHSPLKTPTSAVDEARIGGGFDVNRTLFDTFSPCGMRGEIYKDSWTLPKITNE